jgi:amidase
MGLISAATDVSDVDDEPQRGNDGISHVQWDLMHRRRGAARRRWAEFFDDVDVLLCPVQPVPPIRHLHDPGGSNWRNSVLADHGGRPYVDLALWTSFIGSAYLPVTVPPIGCTAGGLPIGVQIVAPYLHDRTALAFATAIEAVLGGYRPPPAANGPIAPAAAAI